MKTSAFTLLTIWLMAPLAGLNTAAAPARKPFIPKGSGATAPASLHLVDPAGAGPYEASWFNPRDGSETKLAAALTAANGECPLPERPDQEDWVLKLRKK